MGIKLTFEITLQSNYHIGSGYGKGFDLDSALLREADNTPVLRGSTLAGLLRGGAYRLLELSPLQKHHRDETLVRLFGSPAQAKRWHIASAHPVMRLTNDSQSVQRVRIDPRTRRAEPRKLFSQEEGNAAQVFRFMVTCAAHDDAALDEAALLMAAARNVRQLGRSRRRGLGECVIHLTDVGGIDANKPADQSWEAWFLNRFDRVWLRGSPVLVVQTKSKAELQAINVTGGAEVCVRIIVRLDEPLIIAERAPAGNQFDSLSYIPGSAVLGTLAGLAAERCNLADLDMYHDFVALFLRGCVIFPMLYPAHHYSDNLYSTIPAPLGLKTCSVAPFGGENQGHGTYKMGTHERCPRCDTKGHKNRLEPVSGFFVLKRGGPYTLWPDRSSELHIQVEEETQRVKQGQLYGYTVLNAGQYFMGELLCANEIGWARLQEMSGIVEKTPLTWRIGKARCRGYGQVTAWLERYDSGPPACIQLPLPERIKGDPTQSLSMALLTDTIISDPWGRQAAGFDRQLMETALGLGPLKIEEACVRTRVVDSFNAYLGLPRWRDTALTAGSVAFMRMLAPPDDWAVRMQRLEAESIGLRRNEGYGRVAFNHPAYDLCQEVQNSAISLDRRMRLERPEKETFMKDWERKLGKHLPSDKLPDARFTALARWLHVHGDESPEELIDRLASMADPKKAFGQPDELLIAAIGEHEYGNRSKDNFFTRDGKDGVTAICKALEYLKKEDSQHWRRGIERLADWLAALAKDKKGGTQ